MDRWCIWIDIEGFSRTYERSEFQALLALGRLMEGIYRIGIRARTESDPWFFAHQIGDGFAIISDWSAEGPTFPISLACFLMQGVLTGGSVARAAVASGEFADVQGCYPEIVRTRIGDDGVVPLRRGLITVFPVMGTVLINAHRLAAGRPKGACLLLDPSVPIRELGQEVVLRTSQDGHLMVDWVHTLTPAMVHMAKETGIKSFTAPELEEMLRGYVHKQGLDAGDEWARNTLAYCGLPPAGNEPDSPREPAVAGRWDGGKETAKREHPLAEEMAALRAARESLHCVPGSGGEADITTGVILSHAVRALRLADGILLLLESLLYREAAILARSLVETAISGGYLLSDPQGREKRARQCVEWSAVQKEKWLGGICGLPNWEDVRDRVDPARLEKLAEARKRFTEEYECQRGDTRHGLSWKDAADAAYAADLYATAYRDFSSFTHAGPGDLGTLTRMSVREFWVSLDDEDPKFTETGARVAVISADCVLRIAEQLGQVIGVKFDPEPHRAELARVLQRAGAPASGPPSSAPGKASDVSAPGQDEGASAERGEGCQGREQVGANADSAQEADRDD